MSEFMIDKEFYILERRGNDPEMSLHKGLDTAIKKIRGYLKAGTKSDDLILTNIKVEKDSLVAQQISWGEIAAKLIQGED